MENKQNIPNEQNHKQRDQEKRTKRKQRVATIDYRPLEWIFADLEFYTRLSSIRRLQYERTQTPAIYVQYLELQNEVKRLQDILQKIMRCPKHGMGKKASEPKIN